MPAAGERAYGLLITLTGLDPFGATSKLPSDRAWAEGVGLLIWMIGLWLVAGRYAFKTMPTPRTGGVRAGGVRAGGDVRAGAPTTTRLLPTAA